MVLRENFELQHQKMVFRLGERVSSRCLLTLMIPYATLVMFLCCSFLNTGSLWKGTSFNNPNEFRPMTGKSSAGGKLSFRSIYLEKRLQSFSSENSDTSSPPEKLSAKENTGVRAAVTATNASAATKAFHRVSVDSHQTDFQPVHDSSIFVYSAYYHSVHRPPVVTVVAIVNRTAMASNDTGQHIGCVYRDGSSSTADKVLGRLTILPDHHGKPFAPAFIRCPLPNTLSLTTSTVVSISASRDSGNTNALKVQPPLPRQYNFLICFSPLHHNFGDVTLVMENLEMAQMLGAQHAIVYNTSISPRVEAVLWHYVRQGFLEVRGWREPPEPVHYKAQMGAINDCLLYSFNRSDFVVFMDFDEMIVPRIHESWFTLIETIREGNYNLSDFVQYRKAVLKMSDNFMTKISRQASRNTQHFGSAKTHAYQNFFRDLSRSRAIGAFSFPNSFFLWDKATNLTKAELQFANRLHVPFLLKQKRTIQLWEDRSKTIVDPRTVEVMGIHRVSSFLEGQKTLLVNESIGLLQHYRYYSSNNNVKDTNILRFASTLVHSMKDTLMKLDMMPH